LSWCLVIVSIGLLSIGHDLPQMIRSSHALSVPSSTPRW
jgi:hypothetical protein